VYSERIVIGNLRLLRPVNDRMEELNISKIWAVKPLFWSKCWLFTYKERECACVHEV